jgi:hypothetical protein
VGDVQNRQRSQRANVGRDGAPEFVVRQTEKPQLRQLLDVGKIARQAIAFQSQKLKRRQRAQVRDDPRQICETAIQKRKCRQIANLRKRARQRIGGERHVSQPRRPCDLGGDRADKLIPRQIDDTKQRREQVAMNGAGEIIVVEEQSFQLDKVAKLRGNRRVEFVAQQPQICQRHHGGDLGRNRTRHIARDRQTRKVRHLGNLARQSARKRETGQ